MTASVLQHTQSAAADSQKSLLSEKCVRVLHVINGEHYAGAERVQDLLASRLPPEGFEVGIACLKPRQFPQMVQSENIAMYNLAMANRFDLRPVWRLIRIVRREQYQILHAHSPRSLLLAAIVSLFTGVPLVYHIHSPTSRDSTNRSKDRLNALVERVALAFCTAVIPVSHSLGRYVRGQGVRDAKVFVVPNGVPRRPTRPGRETQHTEQSEWIVGTMALFRPRKGLEILLRAIAELKAGGCPVKLRAVGGFETPEYQQQIEKLADDLGIAACVEWTGFVRDVDTELQRMDVFVLPSLFGEGLPMVILEAMAAGVPVVASDVEGIGETIRHGRDGLVVKPGDAAELTAALKGLVEGEFDWNSLRKSANERHAAMFSDAAMAAGVAEVYRRVLKQTD